jgi:hypothetical protein
MCFSCKFLFVAYRVYVLQMHGLLAGMEGRELLQVALVGWYGGSGRAASTPRLWFGFAML